MLNCDIDGSRLVCVRCGAHVTSAGVMRNCRRKAPGLGDYVSRALAAVGITEKRVSAAIGRPCGCTQRAEQLNALGRRIGIG